MDFSGDGLVATGVGQGPGNAAAMGYRPGTIQVEVEFDRAVRIHAVKSDCSKERPLAVHYLDAFDTGVAAAASLPAADLYALPWKAYTGH